MLQQDAVLNLLYISFSNVCTRAMYCMTAHHLRVVTQMPQGASQDVTGYVPQIVFLDALQADL